MVKYIFDPHYIVDYKHIDIKPDKSSYGENKTKAHPPALRAQLSHLFLHATSTW